MACLADGIEPASASAAPRSVAVVRMCAPTDAELLEALLVPGVLRSLIPVMRLTSDITKITSATTRDGASEQRLRHAYPELMLLAADCGSVIAKVAAATLEASDAQLQDVLDDDVVEVLQRSFRLQSTPLHKLDCFHLTVRMGCTARPFLFKPSQNKHRQLPPACLRAAACPNA